MQSTTNYGLNIVEGTDIVNPLTQFNPNFADIDTIMKANADASIDHATCIKTGTVHAVTRSNPDASVFRFTATGNWNAGDTMTVDGTLVSVFNPDGTAPSSGCFVINTEVLAAIQGTRVTLYAVSSSASNIPYDNTSSGLTATNVQDAIDEVSSPQGESVTISAASGATVTTNNVRKIGKLVCGVCGINYIYTPNTWVTVATISDKPATNVFYPALNAGTGDSVGMVQITSQGDIMAYLTQAANGVVFSPVFWKL